MGRIVGLIIEQEAQKLACPHCGKEYSTEEGLAKHIKDKHPEVAADPPTGGSQE